MSINQRQPKFNLSAHISVKESQKLKINCFFPPYPLALTGPQNLGVGVEVGGGAWGGEGTAHKQNAAVGQTEASSGPCLVHHETEVIALPPTKQTSDLVLTGQKRIFQASMKQGGHAMINSNNF